MKSKSAIHLKDSKHKTRVCVFLFVYALYVIHHSLDFLSNQDVGHKQSSDGGQGQAEPGGPGQTGSSITQVCAAARLSHDVDGGVGAAGWEVHFFGLVALGHCKTALHLEIHEADCGVTANTHNRSCYFNC